MLRFVAKHSKQRKTTKVIKLRQFASIWRQNVELRRKTFKTTQNYKSNQITMNLHRFDVKTIKNVELRRKTFKTTQNYKSDHTITCIDLHRFRVMSKHSKQLKTTKTIKLQWIASIWRHNDKNVELRRKTFKTTQNYKSNQITMTCIDLMSMIKNVEYVAKHSKQHKTTKRSNYDNLHRFDVKTIKNVELRRKTFKTTQNYKSDHITMNLHRFHVKTIKTTQNYKNDQITMNCIDLTS